MPHAHATIWGARELSRRIPVGIGTPSATPIGTSSAAATAMRALLDSGIAHATIGVAITITATAIRATVATAAAPLRRNVASVKRRLHAAPRPVPSSSEKSVTVSEYTG